MNTSNLEYRLEELIYWCREVQSQEAPDKTTVGYVYVHCTLLVDELEARL